MVFHAGKTASSVLIKFSRSSLISSVANKTSGSLVKSIEKPDFLSLTFCRDFKGRNNEITQSLKYLLEKVLGIKTGKPLYQKLPKTSHAHVYSNMMRRDSKNLLKSYVDISMEDIEKFLIKKNKVTPRGR